MNVSFLDVLDRAHNGPFCTEKEWDTKVIPGAVASVLKKYELNGTCDPNNPINCDDALADRFWEAGLDLAVDVGMLCTTTERVIKFSHEEFLSRLEEAPDYLQLGTGLDTCHLQARKPEDSRPPTTCFGGFGIIIDEELFIPVMQSHCQNWSVDGTVPGCLSTVYGRELRSRTPYETLGGAHEGWLVREALKRAGRPGMWLNGVATAPSEYGVFGGVGFPQGYAIGQTSVPCLNPAELKTGYSLLHIVVHCLNVGVPVSGGIWSIIGGYAGGPEGCTIAAVAASILDSIVIRADIVSGNILDTRYLGDCGRDNVWADSVAKQAMSRNSRRVLNYCVNPVSGALTEMILREITVSALVSTVSGASVIMGIRTAGGKFSNHTTGLESGYAGEVVKAAAGMTREQANEIVKQLLPKYEDELKRPPTGATFPECFDVKTVKPTKEWQDIYRKIKREVAELGVPFSRWE